MHTASNPPSNEIDPTYPCYWIVSGQIDPTEVIERALIGPFSPAAEARFSGSGLGSTMRYVDLRGTALTYDGLCESIVAAYRQLDNFHSFHPVEGACLELYPADGLSYTCALDDVVPVTVESVGELLAIVADEQNREVDA